MNEKGQPCRESRRQSLKIDHWSKSLTDSTFLSSRRGKKCRESRRQSLKIDRWSKSLTDSTLLSSRRDKSVENLVARFWKSIIGPNPLPPLTENLVTGIPLAQNLVTGTPQGSKANRSHGGDLQRTCTLQKEIKKIYYLVDLLGWKH